MPLREKKGGFIFFVAGLVATVFVHLGVLGAFWYAARASASKPEPVGPGQFVDAQLVKFGKPRDMSFLPHKQGRVKTVGPEEGLKVARDIHQAPSTEKKKEKPDEIDPLKKTHTEQFKNLKDPDAPEGFTEQGEGSLTGSRAGTATEARGDPYILKLIDQIGTAWTVPTSIGDAELAKLSADVCLTINDKGELTKFKFERKSGNSQFDSSLEGALGTIKMLDAGSPPDRWRKHAENGRLCPTFSKQ